MTSDELRVLIPEAQSGNYEAINRLCEGFSRYLYYDGQMNQRQIATLCELSVRGVGYQKDLAVKLIRDKFYK